MYRQGDRGTNWYFILGGEVVMTTTTAAAKDHHYHHVSARVYSSFYCPRRTTGPPIGTHASAHLLPVEYLIARSLGA